MFLTRAKRFLPWSTVSGEIERLDRELSSLFGGFGDGVASSLPAFNVWSDEDGVVVTSELPGVKMEDVELTVSGNSVSIKGARKEEAAEASGLIRRERIRGDFSRTIELPFQIDAAKVEAKLSDGVLKVTLPRSEADKPRKIAVSAG